MSIHAAHNYVENLVDGVYGHPEKSIAIWVKIWVNLGSATPRLEL